MSKFTISAMVEYVDTITSYNTLCGLVYADEYHGRRLNNALWRNADEDTRTSALYWATDILNRQDWCGNPVSYEQSLAWPRKYVPNRLSVHRNWDKTGGFFTDFDTIHNIEYLPQDRIPSEIQDATAELAQFLLARTGTGKDQAAAGNDQLENLTLGGLTMSFREEDDYSSDIPPNVYFQIKDFLNTITEGDSTFLGARSVKVLRK